VGKIRIGFLLVLFLGFVTINREKTLNGSGESRSHTQRREEKMFERVQYWEDEHFEPVIFEEGEASEVQIEEDEERENTPTDEGLFLEEEFDVF